MVANFLKNGRAIFSLPQSNILEAAFLIMTMGVASRILGLLRDRLLAHQFGASEELAAYFAAFRIPDFLYQILIFGTISVAFIPIFTDYWEKKKSKEAFRMASLVMNFVLLFFILLVFLSIIFARPLSNLIAPGLTKKAEIEVVLINLTRILLIGQVILAASSFFSSIAQSLKRFLIPAIAPIFYNVGIILGIIVLVPVFGIYGVALGVFLGSILHLLIQLPLVTSFGFSFVPKISFSHPGLKDLISLSVPRSLGLFAGQISETVDVFLASLISAQSIVVLNFALHLQTVPLGLFALSLAQAVLPALSSQYSQGNLEEFRRTILESFHQLLFLILPSMAILIVLRVPITRIVFGAPTFDWPATLLTAQTLAFLSAGLVFQGVVFILARGFYALHDTKTPLFVGVFSIIVNIILSVIFVQVLSLPVWSLGLSASIGSALNAVFLAFLIDKKVLGFPKKDLFIPAGKILIASLVMGLALWGTMKFLDVRILDTTRTINLLGLTFSSLIVGFAIFVLLALFLKIKELFVVLEFIKKLGRVTKVLGKPKELVEPTTPYS